MKKDLASVSARYPVGTKVRYRNPGKRGDGNVAEVASYLFRHGDEPERVRYVEIRFGDRMHTVTVNQIQNYYDIVP